MVKTVLFVTYGGGHVHMVYPVIDALKQSQEYKGELLNIQVLALPAAQAIFRDRGIPYFSFAKFLDPIEDADAIMWGEELASLHHSPTIGASRQESVAYLGLCYKDLVVRHGESQARKLFEAGERNCFRPLTILDRVLDDIEPDMVVTTNSPRAEEAAIERANARKIPTLIMNDLFSGYPGYLQKSKHVTFLSEFAKDRIISEGNASEKLSKFHVTGNPAFDNLLEIPEKKQPKWLATAFPALKGRKAVLHADVSSWVDTRTNHIHYRSKEDLLEELDLCYNSITSANAVHLVRPHPSQDQSFYRNWVNSHEHAIFANHCDLHMLLKNVDLVLVRNSTLALQAIGLGQTVIQLQPTIHGDMPVAEVGAAIGIDNLSHLNSVIEETLDDHFDCKALQQARQFIMPRIKAAKKIGTIIQSCLD